MSIFYLIFQQTLMVAVAITMVSLGGMLSERSGVANIALEGLMSFSAFVGIMLIHLVQISGLTINPQLLLILAIVISGLFGALLSLPLAYSAISMGADQTIGGTAINMIAPALVGVISSAIIGVEKVTFVNDFFIRDGFFLSNIPIIGDLFFKNTYITIYIGIALWLMVIVLLYKKRFGLRLRACGEHPQAADSVGINVYKMRYMGVILSGLFAGIGGFMLIVTTVGTYSGDVNGYGFLALGVVIFGKWNPKLIFPAALFFAFMNTIASFNSAIPWLTSLDVPVAIYKMLPYVATLVILAITSRKSHAPKSVGVPYDKSKR